MSEERFALILIRERQWRNAHLQLFVRAVIEKGCVDRELTELKHVGDVKADKKRDLEWDRLYDEAYDDGAEPSEAIKELIRRDLKQEKADRVKSFVERSEAERKLGLR